MWRCDHGSTCPVTEHLGSGEDEAFRVSLGYQGREKGREEEDSLFLIHVASHQSLSEPLCALVFSSFSFHC